MDRTQTRVARLERLGEEWAAAELRADAEALEQALTDGFVGVGPLGFTLTKEQWLDRHEPGALSHESFEWDGAQVRLYEKAAVVTGRETMRGRYEGRAIEGRFRGTLLFVEHSEGWSLASVHLSPLAEGS